MSLIYRKLTRDTIRGALESGFNPKIAELAPIYNVPAFTIDFSPTSPNFAQKYIDENNIEGSSLMDFSPVAGCIYTDEAEDSGEPRGVAFSGAVMACVDWFVRPRDGAEGQDTESILDMIEDATMSVLLSISGQVISDRTGIWRVRRSQALRERLLPLGDGYFSKVKIRDQFAAKVT